VFLEQNVDVPLGDRIGRWWAAYSGPLPAYLPLVMVDSGRQVSSGSQTDFKAAYRKLVAAELLRPPEGEIEAYARPLGTRVRVYARLRNTADITLSAANKGALHAVVWEDRRVGVTSRIVRAAPWVTTSPRVAPGGEFAATLETSDLSGVDLDAVRTVVVADYVPGPGPAFDMLQGALAEPVALTADPEIVTVALDATGHEDGAVPVRLRGSYVLRWTAVTDVPWITVTPDAGPMSIEPTLTLTSEMLSPGWQEVAVTFPASSEDGMRLAEVVAVRAFLGSRVLRAGTATAARGDRVTIPVELEALGNENSVSFSLAFDAAALNGLAVAPGADGDAANITVNDAEAAAGRVGVTFAVPAGQTLEQGERQLLDSSFSVAPGPSTSRIAVGFADQPVPRRVADREGRALATTYGDGAVSLPDRPVVRPPRRHLPGGL
jgi:hypothetical protein